MGSDAQQRSALAAGLEDEAEFPVLEIPHATVHEPRRPARRPACEVVPFHQRDAKPAHRRVARDAGTRDASADDEKVESLGRERFERTPALGVGRR